MPNYIAVLQSLTYTRMGNIASGETPLEKLVTSQVARDQLHTAFRREAKEALSNIELISISRSLFGKIVGLNERISYANLLEKLKLQILLTDDRGDLLYCFLKTISNAPCFSNSFDIEDKSFSLYDILILVSVLNSKGLKKFGLNDEYLVHLIFVVLVSSSPPNEHSRNHTESEVDLIIDDNKIKWSLLPIVQSFDKLENTGMTRAKLHDFLNILLPLSVHPYNSNSFTLNYTPQIDSILSTIFLSSSTPEDTISFEAFYSNYKNYYPYLFNPLRKLLHPLLYDGTETSSVDSVAHPQGEQSTSIDLNHKILNFQLLSQLSTILDVDNLNIAVNSRPLYQGSRDGYSINSIQSHTLNYRASTLLLISGRIIGEDRHFGNTFFSKFPKFHPVLNSDLKLREKQKFQITVFLTEQWRITNTRTFGSKGFKIVQLSPFQLVLDSDTTLREDYAYFSNIGCGLGFGSKPPVKSKDLKDHSLKFNLGGVSLTIDNSLEKGNFRIEDMSTQSSTYATSNVDKQLFNDVWFKINDIEIYGLGNLQSLKDQKLAMEWEEREAERRRGLGNKDYNEGKALLELAGIIGGAHSGGSM